MAGAGVVCLPPAAPDRRRRRVNRQDLVTASHLAGADAGQVVKARPPGHVRQIRRGDTVTSPASGPSAADLPDYAPIPQSALGPALNEQGYYVGRVERNLYYVTDGVYQSAFLATPEGVVVFDAPPSIGNNVRRAVDEIAAANGVPNTVTHFVYSHHHADHGGAASLFGGDVIRIGHEETRRLLLRDDDPARPVPGVTFADRYSLTVGGERVELAWHGSNHSPDNIYIHFPGHDTLMFIDVVNAGWVPIYNVNLSEDVMGYMAAPDIALSYPWTHFISGHLGRLATHDDVAVHQQYIADIEASAREALAAIDPVPYYVAGGQNFWAGVKGHLDAVTDRAAAPVIAKYTGVLAAADIGEFTRTTTFQIMQSLRLDRGPSGPVHP
jgi:glyoxylase-like metal-dependent hydrolase (beta-lactamase superfamily II)